MLLKDLYNLEYGVIKNRILENKEYDKYEVYTKNHFDNNLNDDNFSPQYVKIDPNEYLMTKENDVIVDSMSLKASIITKQEAGMLVTFNYFILRKKKNLIDNNFFICWFNESVELEKQIHVELQGSTIKKLTLSQLSNFKISLPNLKKQKVIGNLYMLQRKKEELVLKETELVNKIVKKNLDNRKEE